MSFQEELYSLYTLPVNRNMLGNAVQKLDPLSKLDIAIRLSTRTTTSKCKRGSQIHNSFCHDFLFCAIYTRNIVGRPFEILTSSRLKNGERLFNVSLLLIAHHWEILYLLACTKNKPAIMIILTRSTTGLGFWSSFSDSMMNILSALSRPMLLLPRESYNNNNNN